MTNIEEQIKLRNEEILQRLIDKHFIELETLKFRLASEEEEQKNKLENELRLAKIKMEEERKEEEQNEIIKTESPIFIKDIKEKLDIRSLDEKLTTRIIKTMFPDVKRVSFNFYEYGDRMCSDMDIHNIELQKRNKVKII